MKYFVLIALAIVCVSCTQDNSEEIIIDDTPTPRSSDFENTDIDEVEEIIVDSENNVLE